MYTLKLSALITSAVLFGTLAHAQTPVVTVDPSRHGNLASAQESLVQAYGRISEAQRENGSHLGGHAQRAKDLLLQANQEIGLASDQADANPGEAMTAPAAGPASAPAPVANINVSGSWTIYAYDVNHSGSSLKQVQLMQNGSVITGKFKGPNQKGNLQGWVNGSHVEFSTDTREILTFRGEVTPDGMSGMYGIHGEHAPWKAQRN